MYSGGAVPAVGSTAAPTGFAAGSGLQQQGPPPVAEGDPLDALGQLAFDPSKSASSGSLLETLKKWRSAYAKQTGKKSFSISSNKMLEAIAEAVPQTGEELLAVHGFGSNKVQEFGAAILDMCRQHAAVRQAAAAAPAGPNMPPPAAAGWQPQQPQAWLGGGPARPPATPQSAAASPWLAARGAEPAAPPAAKRQRGDHGAAAASTSVIAPPQVIEASALTDEQRTSAQRALRGENLFVTGAAGTGKSFLLRYIIQELEKAKPGLVAVTAPTGLAAVNVGGQTVHSWAGIGGFFGERVKEMRCVERAMVATIRKQASTLNRWVQTVVLVLDEVSMLEPELFDYLDFIGRELRQNRQAGFGGLQLLLCGDFLQLPPVEASSNPNAQYAFCFETQAWQRCGLGRGTVILQQPVRQSGDPNFVRLLNAVRAGMFPQEVATACEACHVRVKPRPTDGIVPTRLYCTNRDVDQENINKLAELPGEGRSYYSADSSSQRQGVVEVAASTKSYEKKRLLDLLGKKAPAELRLKVDAQVILTRKLASHNLVNGSRGVVVQLHDNSATVRFDTGEVVKVERDQFSQTGSSSYVVRKQLPLKLGWALTVHKSQGMTLSRAEVQLDNAFSYGQVYVALSRLTNFAGLWISGRGISQRCIRAHPSALRFYGLGAACG